MTQKIVSFKFKKKVRIINCLFNALVRVKALVSNENERIASQRSRLAQLQQRNREFRERNDALEVQLSLLRRRLADLEDGEAEARKHLASAAVMDREHKRLTKQLEQTRAEFYALQAENGRLKSEANSDGQNTVSGQSSYFNLKAVLGMG